jgi:hypothetical protein
VHGSTDRSIADMSRLGVYGKANSGVSPLWAQAMLALETNKTKSVDLTVI